MEKVKRALRLAYLITLMVLASVGMSISGAAPVIPKHKETVMEDEAKTQKNNEEEESEENQSQDEKKN